MDWRIMHIRIVHEIALKYHLLMLAKNTGNNRVMFSMRRRVANAIVEKLGKHGDGYYPGRAWRRKFYREHGFWPKYN